MDEGYDNNVTATSTASAGVPGATAQRRRGAVLESAILAAAYDELTTVGYTNFSVENVALRARTGKASIYRRWPRKAELVMDAMGTLMPRPADCGIELMFGDDVSTVDALHHVAFNVSLTIASPAGDAMRAIKYEATVDPELAALVDERFQAPRRAALLSILHRGVQRGEVRPEAATALVADVLPAVLVHRMVMGGETLGEAAVVEIIDQVLVPLISRG